MGCTLNRFIGIKSNDYRLRASNFSGHLNEKFAKTGSGKARDLASRSLHNAGVKGRGPPEHPTRQYKYAGKFVGGQAWFFSP